MKELEDNEKNRLKQNKNWKEICETRRRKKKSITNVNLKFKHHFVLVKRPETVRKKLMETPKLLDPN